MAFQQENTILKVEVAEFKNPVWTSSKKRIFLKEYPSTQKPASLELEEAENLIFIFTTTDFSGYKN